MIRLLDVNVLVSLIDPDHVHHEPAHRWFAQEENQDWATCAITENGLVRVVSGVKYPQRIGVSEAVTRLQNMIFASGRHAFWTESISLLDTSLFRVPLLTSGLQITDAYLLALAVHNRGMLATFDRRISPESVVGGEAALYLIPT